MSFEVTNDLINLCTFCFWAQPLLFRWHYSTSSPWLYLQKHCTLAFLSNLVPAKAILNKWSSHLPHTWVAGLFQSLVGDLVLLPQCPVPFQPAIPTIPPDACVHLTLTMQSAAQYFLLIIACCHTDFLPTRNITTAKFIINSLLTVYGKHTLSCHFVWLYWW